MAEDALEAQLEALFEQHMQRRQQVEQERDLSPVAAPLGSFEQFERPGEGDTFQRPEQASLSRDTDLVGKAQAAGEAVSTVGKEAMLPMIMSGAGTILGAGMSGGNPLVTAATETIFDILGTTANMVLGIEPWSSTQLILSATTPFIPRVMARGGKAFLTKGKAAKFAVQEETRRKVEKMKTYVEMVTKKAEFPKSLSKWHAEEEATRLKRFLELQLPGRGAANLKYIQDTLPVPTEAVINELYDNVKRFRLNIPIDAYREVQKDILAKSEAAARVSKALPRPEITALAGDEAERARTVVAFEDVREALSLLGRQWRDLIGVDGAGEQRRHLGQLMRALNDSLEAASKRPGLAADARNALRAASRAHAVRQTGDELAVFSERFVKNIPGKGEMLDAAEMKRILNSRRDEEGMAMRDALKKAGWLGQMNSFLDKVIGFQGDAVRQLDVAAQRGRVKKLGGALMDTMKEKVDIEGMKAMPPLSHDLIVRPDLQTIFRAAFTGASVTAAGINLYDSVLGSGDVSGGQAFSLGAGVASGLVLPTVFTMMFMTPTGQKFMLKMLEKSDGIVTETVAGMAGAYLRATVFRATEQIIQEQKARQQAIGQPQQAVNQ